MTWKYFNRNEFTKLSWDNICVKTELINKLDKARAYAKVPFIITSAHRTEEQNMKAGGVKRSSHLKGLAVDIKCNYSDKKMLSRIFYGIIKSGFSRIGIADNYIHVDIDDDKPESIWIYK